MKYKVIPRLNPQKPNDSPKYFARIVRPENITLEKLSKRIAEISPLSEIDTKPPSLPKLRSCQSLL